MAKEEKEEKKTSEKNKEEDQTSEKSEAEEKEKPDYKKKADAMYAKYKDAKEELEDLKKKAKSKEKNKDKLPEDTDIETIIEVSSAIEGLDSREQKRLMTEAKQKDISLSEARNDEDFQLWRDSYKRKVEKENKDIKPSTKQTKEEKGKSLEEMSLKEKEDYFTEKGWIKPKKSWKDK